MKERDFIRELNSRDNKDGNMTSTLVFDLIYQQKKGESKPPFFARVRNMFSNEEEKAPQDVLSNCFDMIIRKVPVLDRLYFLSLLTEEEPGRYAIKKNFDVFLDYIVDWHRCGFAFSKLREGKTFDSFLDDNIDTIYDMIEPEDALETSLALSHISSKSDSVINKYITNHKKDYTHTMYLDALAKRTRQISKEDLSKKIEPFVSPISQIIDELVESGNVTYADISFLGKGAYSSVYGIGDKVLKIGAKRANFNYPNHRRILQPLARRILSQDDFSSIIEVSPKVKTLNKDQEDKEKLYEVYKELRDSGIVWADVRFDNIGILNGPNLPTLYGKPFYVSPDAAGTDREISEEELSLLRAGDWVIIDTDHLYKEKEFEKETDEQFQALRPLYKEFKLRYTLEKLKQNTSSLGRSVEEIEQEK